MLFELNLMGNQPSLPCQDVQSRVEYGLDYTSRQDQNQCSQGLLANALGGSFNREWSRFGNLSSETEDEQSKEAWKQNGGN